MPQRLTTQFHWFNRDYRDFQDFLDRFSSRKRKNLRREREQIARQGLSLKTLKGEEIGPEQWQFFHRCYQTTYAKRSGHGGYLTELFLLKPVRGWDRCRSWSSQSETNSPSRRRCFLRGRTHFTDATGVASQSLSSCISRPAITAASNTVLRPGLSRFDPGAQGEHKIQRGFEPILTYSNHWIVDERLREAVAQFAEQESEQVRAYQREASTLYCPSNRRVISPEGARHARIPSCYPLSALCCSSSHRP